MPLGFGFSPQWIALMIATVALGLITQGYIKLSFRKWSAVAVSSGMTGAQVAQTILVAHGLESVQIRQVGGKLSDNYDPRTKVLNLSENVYGVSSVAAAGVAAHEAGHAVQDAKRYVWGTVRTALVPAANIGSSASWVLIFVGFWIQVSGLVWLGIAFYGMAVLFQIVHAPRRVRCLATCALGAPGFQRHGRSAARRGAAGAHRSCAHVCCGSTHCGVAASLLHGAGAARLT